MCSRCVFEEKALVSTVKSDRCHALRNRDPFTSKVSVLDTPAVSTLSCEAGVTSTKNMRVANVHAPFLRSKDSGNERSTTSLLHAF